MAASLRLSLLLPSRHDTNTSTHNQDAVDCAAPLKLEEALLLLALTALLADENSGGHFLVSRSLELPESFVVWVWRESTQQPLCESGKSEKAR